MISFSGGISFLLAAFTAGAVACSEPAPAPNTPRQTGASNSSSENPSGTNTNIEELGVLVRVPYQAADVVWKEYPSRRQIVAVMRLSPADAKKLVDEAGVQPETTSVEAESWFPEELTAQSEMSGDNALNGLSYPATAFFQEPYNTGKITRVVGSDYFILDLAAR